MIEKCTATCRDGSSCGSYPVSGEDKCRMHLGKSADGSSHEGNANAVSHGAFQEHFTEDLSEGEQDAFDDAFRKLENPEGAQDVARSAASICLLQFQRSGDERFLRRFEGICDKFGIAPADELEVSGSFSVEEEFMKNLKQANGYEVDD